MVGILGGIGAHSFAYHPGIRAQPSLWKRLVKDLSTGATEGLSKELRGKNPDWS